jgi:hypothetical protein
VRSSLPPVLDGPDAMNKAILYTPSDEAIDRSLDARKYVNRLSKRLSLERRRYDTGAEPAAMGPDVDSVAVLAGLSALELESGYVEMELDTVFRPQELVAKLRSTVGRDFAIVAIVDDAYSDYVMSSFIRAGASAVVGTSGDLFGAVMSRLRTWQQLFPYLNVFERL